MGQNFWGASGQNASPSPAPVSPQRRSAPTLLMSGALNRHNRQQLAADGCERRPQTQMASKRVCRRPATSSLRRWLRAKNFCLVSCGANQIKTNQLEAIAPILLTDFFFRADCAQCTSRRVQGAASSNLQAMCEWDANFR